MGLYLGNTTATVNASGTTGGINSSTLHLRGQLVLSSQLKTLAGLGLAKATQILITGIGHDGTMAILHADSLHVRQRSHRLRVTGSENLRSHLCMCCAGVQAQLLELAPGLKTFGVRFASCLLQTSVSFGSSSEVTVSVH